VRCVTGSSKLSLVPALIEIVLLRNEPDFFFFFSSSPVFFFFLLYITLFLVLALFRLALILLRPLIFFGFVVFLLALVQDDI